MESELGITSQQMAWVFAAFGLAYALFEVPSGWLGDKFGPRLVLCRIVLWWSLFTALTGCVWYFTLDSGHRLTIDWLGIDIPLLFNSFLLLLLIRFLFGAGEAGAYPNTARALRNWFPYRRRGLAQGFLWSCGRWGGALAPLLIGLLAFWFGWRGAFLAFGVMGVVWVVGFYSWYRDTPRQHPSVNQTEIILIEEGKETGAKPAPLSWRAMLKAPTLWWLCLMYFCSNCGWVLFITWDVKYYQSVQHLSGWPLRIAAGAPLFFGGIACFLGGFLTDRQVRIWGRRWGRTLQGVLAYGLGGLFFLAAVFMPNPFLAVGAMCLASFTKDFAMAASWSTCIDVGHRYSGTVSGFMNMVGNLGTFFSPWIVEWLSRATAAEETTNWNAALWYSGIMFLVASVCWLFINPRRVIVYSPADRQRLTAEGILD